MMYRGDVVIIAQKGVYEGKPRPAVVVQNQALLEDHPSILVCLISAGEQNLDDVFYRIAVQPSSRNGLKEASTILADKIATIRRKNIGGVIGRLEEAALGRLDSALALFQGLA